MKYMFKLTTFATLCLLVASCHTRSSTSTIATVPSVTATAVARGVIEKGAVKDADCHVSKVNDLNTVYSRAIVQNGSYAATIPREPFAIFCNVTSYISDTGTDDSEFSPDEKNNQEVVLGATGFVEKAEEITLNINVLTTLVTNQIGADLGNIKSTSDLEKAKQAAIAKLNKQYGITIGNIDGLRLKDQGVLAKVSMAVQQKLEEDQSIPANAYSFDGDSTELTKADIDAVTSLANFNSNAIVNSITKLTPQPALTTHVFVHPPSGGNPTTTTTTTTKTPAPAVITPPTIHITTVSIGKQQSIDLTPTPMPIPVIDLTAYKVPFSIPSTSIHLGDEINNGVYITNDRPNAGVIALTIDKAHSVYETDDIKDSFTKYGKQVPSGTSMKYTICILPKAALSLTDCNSKNNFIFTVTVK